MLAGLDLRVVTLADVAPELDIPEHGETFMDNARHKALTAARETGLLTLADDSGLAVDALHGAPGVHSKRFAETDAARIAKLLDRLADVPDAHRTARFHSAMAIATPEGVVAEIEETVEGRIIHAPRGTQGFGYDPIFLPEGFDRTMAELSMEEKNAISHRGKAFRRAVEFLRGWLMSEQ